MNGRRVRWFGAILLLTLIAAIVGIGAYRMGVAQGIALGMAQVEEGGRAAAYSHAWHGHGYGPGWYGYGWHGPGFGFGFLVPLLFIFLWVAALKMLIWRGRGPRGPWGHGGPWRRGWGGPWHRRPRGRWRDFDRYDDDRRSFDDDRDWHRRGTTL
jgi:hypothetical protein